MRRYRIESGRLDFLHSMKVLAILSGIVLAMASSACTIFIVSRGGQVFAAGNEDEDNVEKNSKHYVRFVPANKVGAKLGYVSFGYKRNPFSDESAMNEAGLFYDFNALDKLDVARPGKPKGKFNAINEMLTSCRTVDEAVKFLEKVDLPFLSSAQMVLGDASGASAIVERHTTTWRSKGSDFQIGTNFRTSVTPLEKITCNRFKACNLELEMNRPVGISSVEDLLNTTKALPKSGTQTWYSLVCDLKLRQVNLYRKGDFLHKSSFLLSEELRKGARKLDMDEFIAAQSSK